MTIESDVKDLQKKYGDLLLRVEILTRQIEKIFEKINLK
jgi:hypothetical protein